MQEILILKEKSNRPKFTNLLQVGTNSGEVQINGIAIIEYMTKYFYETSKDKV